jgi:hypothetical protein
MPVFAWCLDNRKAFLYSTEVGPVLYPHRKSLLRKVPKIHMEHDGSDTILSRYVRHMLRILQCKHRGRPM